ncbi:MAG: hypothetical protein JO302_04520, partial [Candidatus Eremiobacteraeota bacterium]|nr:hypothetical protein [Candidatus Eremiobacteraeota bacterium]
MARSRGAAALVLAALGLNLAACSGGYAGGNASLPSTLGDSGPTVSDTADALVARRTGSQNARAGIEAANALGARLRQLGLATLDDAWNGGLVFAKTPSRRCHDGVELFAPDRNGDANSTEALFFYDPACTQLAIDDVRIYSPISASSETVNRSDSLYPPASATAIAISTTHSTISNATFGNYGLPLAPNGFALRSASAVTFLKTPVLTADAQFVMMPGSQGSNAFCEDSAGYDPSGIPSLDETFGWQGGALSGASRSAIGKTLVRWSATPTGTVYRASIGALSIGTGTQNTTCPIGTPGFTLSGGTAIGTYSIPLVVMFRHGMLTYLSVRHATLPNGDTLNVRTTGGRRGQRNYIDGSL